MDGEQLEILKELIASVVPLGVLTVIVLAVILFGICTATESAAIGALGALYLAVMAKYPREVWWWSLVGAVAGLGLGWYEGSRSRPCWSAAAIGGTFLGRSFPGSGTCGGRGALRNLKQSTFLTAKTTAMVCWLFIGSALFSAVFALHGGQGADRAVGAGHEPLAGRLPDHRRSSSSSCWAGRSSGRRSS